MRLVTTPTTHVRSRQLKRITQNHESRYGTFSVRAWRAKVLSGLDCHWEQIRKRMQARQARRTRKNNAALAYSHGSTYLQLNSSYVQVSWTLLDTALVNLCAADACSKMLASILARAGEYFCALLVQLRPLETFPIKCW